MFATDISRILSSLAINLLSKLWLSVIFSHLLLLELLQPELGPPGSCWVPPLVDSRGAGTGWGSSHKFHTPVLGCKHHFLGFQDQDSLITCEGYPYCQVKTTMADSIIVFDKAVEDEFS